MQILNNESLFPDSPGDPLISGLVDNPVDPFNNPIKPLESPPTGSELFPVNSQYGVEDTSLTDGVSVNSIESSILPSSDNNSPIDPLTGEPVASLPNTDFTSGTFVVGNTGQVNIEFLYDGGAYKSEIGIFSLTGMEEFVPGSAEFIKEAAKRASSHSEQGYIVISDANEAAKFTGDLGEVNNFNWGEHEGNKTFLMQPGDKFGIILVPNGTIEEVQENPELTGNKRPLFSLATANPEDAFHVGQIADVTGEGNLFVMEDLRVDVGSDFDYNDLIFSLFGATGTATVLDELINPNLDWRTTPTGQEIITYVQEQSALLQSTPESASDEVSETIDALEPSGDGIAVDDSTVESNLDIDSTDNGVESTSIPEETESLTPLSDETTVEPTEPPSIPEETESSTLLPDDTDNGIESTSVSTETSPSIGDDSDTSNLTEFTSISTETSEPTESPDETSTVSDSDTVKATESNVETSSSIQSDSDKEDILPEPIASSDSATTTVILEETPDSEEFSLGSTETNSSSLTTDDTDLHGTESVPIREISVPQSFPNFSQGVFQVGETGAINIEYIFDGGYYQGTVGLFNMAGLSEYEWGSAEFFREIARRSLSNSDEGYVLISDSTEAAKLDGKLEDYDWNRGIKQGEKTFSLPEGTEFGLILIPDGTLQELFDNPQVTGSKKPFLSLTPSDPERALHQPQLVDVTGDGNLFAWEDLRLPGGDADFNDITFKMSGATGIVTNLDEVIAPDSDWRNSQIGQQILNEVQIEAPNSDKEPPQITAQLFSDSSGNEPFNPVVRGNITDASPIIRLRAGFDATPVEEFVDVTAYLQADGSFSLDRQILEQILGNSLAGNSHVLHLISEDAGRLIGVKAIRVGNLVPENDAHFNQALAEFYGLDPYPDSLTLVAGTTRQLSLTINELESRPNLSAGETGTRYFVSHPDLLQVNEDGLVTALDEGEAAITIIHGAQMVTIPISVQKPLAGSVTLGAEGGVVEAVDGSLVMVPPGGLETETAVSLTPLTGESLSLPLPESLDLVGAFSLDLGDEPLTQPAQLAIPAPAGLSAGSEVLFLRKSSLPDETGTWNPTWSIEEAGVVDEEGTIRTTSWPFNGILASGQYAVLAWPSAGLSPLGLIDTGISQITASQWATSTAGGINLTGNLSLATTSLAAQVGFLSIAALTYGQFVATAYLLAYLAKYLQTDLEIIGIPQVGLPVVTTAGVELTAEGVPSVTAVLNTPPPGPADPLAPPVLQQAELTFSNNEPVVVLSGSNFLNDFNDIGSSFEDLAVEFRVGDKSYPGILIPERSVELGDNRYEIAIKVPNIVVLGEAEIVLIRRQKEQMGPLPTDSEIVEKESTPIQLTPTCVELALVAKETADAISIINAHAPESVIEAGSSSDLLRANIPVGTPDREDKPVELAATNNATRAYVLLQESGRVGLVDLMTWQQVDTNSETPEIDPIDLPAGASPQSIALDPGDNYAYIADGKIGALYILDINPNSATYHQIIQTISLPSASWGLRQISMSSDGRKLFVAAPDYSWPFSDTKGQIHVVNIDPRDRPTNPDNNPRLWHEKIGSISTYSEVDGVFAKNNGGIAFTNSRRDSAGFGVVEILNDDPLNFTVGTPRYVSLGLGSFSDYFDINWAVSVDILKDGSYAFVASKNNSSQTGVESIDGLRAGSNIGIIKDPFGPNAKLVAATRPIPGGKTADLVLSSDEKYLYASYPGLELSDSTDKGGIFVFDVEEMIATVENPGNFWLDSLKRGVGSVGFNENTKRLASENDLGSVPIDDINPDISVAADYEIIGGNWLNDFTFGVPEDTIKAPLGIGGMPTGLTLVSASNPLQLVSPGISGVADSLTPTFEWKFGDEDEDDVCGAIDPDEVKEVRLYVSVFPKGEGLLPGDTWPELDSPTPGRDYNPNRVLTATWKEGVWTWNGGSQAGSKDQFTLPDDRMLTAGQEYHWAVEAVINGSPTPVVDDSQFKTPQAVQPGIDGNAFSSVTVLTRGLEFQPNLINQQFEQMALHITQPFSPEDDGGLVMYYEAGTGQWYWRNNQGTKIYNIPESKFGSPLVLIPDLEMTPHQTGYNSGFAEAAADAMFASLVSLNQQLDNDAFFKSPIHFIGVGQGAVINSEIIQRMGTFFPNLWGTDDNPADLMMTTIDPHDFSQSSLPSPLRSQNDPEVKVWENVTFADNYYQNVAESEEPRTKTRNGREIDAADWNVVLSQRAGFTPDDTENSPHRQALAWYAGTTNLSGSELPLLEGAREGEKIYRRLGDLEPLLRTPNSDSTWYSPDYRGYPDIHGAQNAPWEGIGTGWFYSVLGGGYQKRPDALLGVRTEVSFDNTAQRRMRGDFAVPTLFNGNFDAITSRFEQQNIPGWSFYNGNQNTTQNVSQRHLVEWSDVGSLDADFLAGVGYNTSQPNYALRLSNDGQNQVTHNRFVVPEWGTLRFNLHVPDLSGGNLKVSLEGENGHKIEETIHLLEANGPYDLGYNDADTYRIGYGITGFETFHVDVPESLRGQVATVKFEIEEGTVYLDEVFFKSQHLLLGNPTLNGQESRPDLASHANNYLIERPQYSLSYNESNKGPNWVSWEVNKTWVGAVPRPTAPWSEVPSDYPGFPNIDNLDYPWRPDSNLPSDLSSPRVSRYRTYNWFPEFDRGHLTASENRNRTKKDQLSTFFISNVLPMQQGFNRYGLWRKLEKFSQDVAVQKGWNLYTMAGGIGSVNQEISPDHPLNKDNITNLSDPINIPDSLWKIIAILKPGQGLADITVDTPIISVILPNDRITQPEDPDAPDAINWYNSAYISTIKEIENLTNLTFLSNLSLSQEEIEKIKNTKYSGPIIWEDFPTA